MNLGILKEDMSNRVSIYPSAIEKFKPYFKNIFIEQNAGEKSFFSDKEYQAAGAEICTREEVLEKADFLFTYQPPVENIPENKKIIGLFKSHEDKTLINRYIEKGNEAFAMEMIPRTTLAQSMDVLSSQGSIDGYRAVIEAASRLPDYFPMFMTAAGTVKPAKVLILGAGVAGLQAIATAKRLGAVVYAMDTRAATETEVQSLGGKFIKLPFFEDLATQSGYAKEADEELLKAQREAILPIAKDCNVVICTAKVRGKKAPVLIDDVILNTMQAGSVVLDLASESGGNCTQTKWNEEVAYNGIHIYGKADYAGEVSRVASTLYTNNLLSFIKILFDADGQYKPSQENEIINAVWHKK